MKTKSSLPNPTLTEDHEFSVLESTLEFISDVFKLTKRVFML